MFINHDFAPVAPLGSNYAEWSYAGPDFWGRTFTAYAFAHIAARDEHLRLKRKRKDAAQAVERRRNGRALFR